MTAPSDEALGHQVEAFGRRLEELGATVTPTRIIEAAFRAGFEAGGRHESEICIGTPDEDEAWAVYAAELQAPPGAIKSDLSEPRKGDRIASIVTIFSVPKSVWAFPAKGDHFHIKADGLLEAGRYQVVEAPVDEGGHWRLTVEIAPGRYAYTPGEPKE